MEVVMPALAVTNEFKSPVAPKQAVLAVINYCGRHERFSRGSRIVSEMRLFETIDSYLEERTDGTAPKDPANRLDVLLSSDFIAYLNIPLTMRMRGRDLMIDPTVFDCRFGTGRLFEVLEFVQKTGLTDLTSLRRRHLDADWEQWYDQTRGRIEQATPIAASALGVGVGFFVEIPEIMFLGGAGLVVSAANVGRKLIMRRPS